ncbi:MAG: glycoside hydrolase family 16 protein [Pseudomonadota bacterium]
MILLALAGLVAPAAPANPAQDGWQLMWSDEFDGARIDRSKWQFAVDCFGGGNHERQCYTDRKRNASVAHGVLTITARREATVGPAVMKGDRTPGLPVARKTQEYSSAKLTTEGKAAWRYGRFEIRARVPLGQGTWPAIWMLPADWAYGRWASSGEIDIMETVNLGAPCGECKSGREDRVLGTLHYGGVPPKNVHKGEEFPYPPILDSRFHIFGLSWSPGRMIWTVDGHPYAERRSSEWYSDATKAPGAPFDQSFYLILNLAVGGGLAESRDLKTVDPAAFPARFEIDWVRVWQCPANQATGSCSE